jgi:hypothetical protein
LHFSPRKRKGLSIDYTDVHRYRGENQKKKSHHKDARQGRRDATEEKGNHRDTEITEQRKENIIHRLHRFTQIKRKRQEDPTCVPV